MTKMRLDWIDAARGASVLLVVLLHATQYAALVGIHNDCLITVNAFFEHCRLPTFFAISGYLARKWIKPDRSWADLITGKLSYLVWPFAVWQAVVLAYVGIASTSLAGYEGDVVFSPSRFLEVIVRPTSELWFLWALVVFTVVSKLLYRRAFATLIMASVVSIMWQTLLPSVLSEYQVAWIGPAWRSAPIYFVYFFAMANFGDKMVGFIGAPSRVFCVMFCVGYVAAYMLACLFFGNLPLALYPIFTVLGVAFTATAVRGLKLSWLSVAGRHTLPIYLAHTFFIVVILALSQSWLARLQEPLAISVVWCGAILASLLLWVGSKNNALRLLYEPPVPVLAALARISRV